MNNLVYSPARAISFIIAAIVSHVLFCIWAALKRWAVPYLQSNLQLRVFLTASKYPPPVVVLGASALVLSAGHLIPHLPPEIYLALIAFVPYLIAAHLLTRSEGLFHVDATLGRHLRVHMRTVESDVGRVPPYMDELAEIVRLVLLTNAKSLEMDSPLLYKASTRRLLRKRFLQLCKEAGLYATWTEKEHVFSAFGSGVFTLFRARYKTLNNRIVWQEPTRLRSCKVTVKFL